MTSSKCRAAALAASGTLKIGKRFEAPQPEGPPIAGVTYSTQGPSGPAQHVVRAFVATGEICGDLEFYSIEPISEETPAIKAAFASMQLDAGYEPQFRDVAFYAQVLFNTGQPRAAAAVYEKALGMVPLNGSPFPSALIARRIMRDQAGMSYGMSGNLKKARAIFEQGIAEDPDYPLYYYNLACADAGEKNLTAAKRHLQQAFDRKANLIAGEKMPIPSEDDSFLPYKHEKEFWRFVEQISRAAK